MFQKAAIGGNDYPHFTFLLGLADDFFMSSDKNIALGLRLLLRFG